LQKEKTEIDISGFSKGLYLLKVTYGDKEEATRILKE